MSSSSQSFEDETSTTAPASAESADFTTVERAEIAALADREDLGCACQGSPEQGEAGHWTLYSFHISSERGYRAALNAAEDVEACGASRANYVEECGR